MEFSIELYVGNYVFAKASKHTEVNNPYMCTLPGLGCKNSLVLDTEVSMACTVQSVFYKREEEQ